MTEEQFSEYLIDYYRDMIKDRYTYQVITKRLELPKELNREIINDVRDFFITYVYPTAKERKQLNEAFSSLSSYMYKPTKIWRLLGNMTMAIFEFGRMFPKAIKAGTKGLSAFMEARKFEENILNSAIELEIHGEVNLEIFSKCLRRIPKKKTKKFLNDVIIMFDYMTDIKLLEKTIEILGKVVEKMKKFPDTYPENDVKGIELGLDILANGKKLFEKYDSNLNKTIVYYIRKNEELFISEIYDS